MFDGGKEKDKIISLSAVNHENAMVDNLHIQCSLALCSSLIREYIGKPPFSLGIRGYVWIIICKQQHQPKTLWPKEFFSLLKLIL